MAQIDRRYKVLAEEAHELKLQMQAAESERASKAAATRKANRAQKRKQQQLTAASQPQDLCGSESEGGESAGEQSDDHAKRAKQPKRVAQCCDAVRAGKLCTCPDAAMFGLW